MSRAGQRNGYQDITVKTTAGPVELYRAKLRNTLEEFASRLLGKHVTRTNALESLVISGWVRGLSDRDITAALAEALGLEATVSKSTVSRICEQIKQEFDAWRTRDLSEVELDYLFVDGSHFQDARRCPLRAGAGRLRHHHRRQPDLCASGRSPAPSPPMRASTSSSRSSPEG